MKWTHLLLPVVVMAAWAAPADAQLFFRKIRLGGMQAPELIVTARTDLDEHGASPRSSNTQGEFDAKYPAIVPSLIEVMLKDPKAHRALETVHPARDFRPTTPEIGQALQYTAQHDDNVPSSENQMWMNGIRGRQRTAVARAPTVEEPPWECRSAPPFPRFPRNGDQHPDSAADAIRKCGTDAAEYCPTCSGYDRALLRPPYPLPPPAPGSTAPRRRQPGQCRRPHQRRRLRRQHRRPWKTLP